MTAHSDRPGYEPISSTLWRQREDYCARLIQGAWRRRGDPGGDPGLFDSILGSRSVLDAVVEEENDELSEYEQSEPILAMNNQNQAIQNGQTSSNMIQSHEGPTIVVHSRSSSVSSTSIVWQRPYQKSLRQFWHEIILINSKLLLLIVPNLSSSCWSVLVFCEFWHENSIIAAGFRC